MEEQNTKLNENKNQKNKKHMRDDTKIGIAVAASALLFFGCLFAIEAGINKDLTVAGPVNSSKTSSPTSSNNSTTSAGPVGDIFDPMKEVVKVPFNGNGTIARNFYDSSLSEEERENAIVTVPGDEGSYQKSLGLDYKFDSDTAILATFSGKVIRVSNDSVLGHSVWIEHESGIVAAYSSLDNVQVNENQEIKQDDIIAYSGLSLYTNSLGESIHFEIIKDNKQINPNKAFGQLVKDL